VNQSDVNLEISSQDRARVNRLKQSIGNMLNEPLVEKVLAQCNKANILITVQDGVAVEITPAPAMRRGKELPR